MQLKVSLVKPMAPSHCINFLSLCTAYNVQHALTRKACDSVWALVYQRPAIFINYQISLLCRLCRLYFHLYFWEELDVFKHVNTEFYFSLSDAKVREVVCSCTVQNLLYVMHSQISWGMLKYFQNVTYLFCITYNFIYFWDHVLPVDYASQSALYILRCSVVSNGLNCPSF